MSLSSAVRKPLSGGSAKVLGWCPILCQELRAGNLQAELILSRLAAPSGKAHLTHEVYSALNPAPDPPKSCGHRLLTQVNGALRKGKGGRKVGWAGFWAPLQFFPTITLHSADCIKAVV